MTIQDVIQIIEKRFPTQQAEDLDNVGLLCGNPERDVSGILVCHDSLEKVVDEAIAKKTNLIVAFHPIVFSGLKKISGKNYVEKALLKALENKIAIYALHTVLDNDFWGVNYKICEELGLKNQHILMPKTGYLSQLQVYVPKDYAENLKNNLFDAGAGKIGFYDRCSFSLEGTGSFRPKEGSKPFLGTPNEQENTTEIMISVVFESYKKNRILTAMKSAHPYEEVAYQILSLDNENQSVGLGRYGELVDEMPEKDFLNFVKEKFDLKIIRHSPLCNKLIKKVGVLGGSGASGIKSALQMGCDAYLTGDLKYHDFFQAEARMLIADIGHFESEQFVSEQIVEFLSKKFTSFAVLKSSENTNPVNYFF